MIALSELVIGGQNSPESKMLLLRILLEREQLVKLHGSRKILHTSPEDCSSVSSLESVGKEGLL